MGRYGSSSRARSLLGAILGGYEDSWSTMSGQEDYIKSHADNVRAMNDASGGELMSLIPDSTIDWLQGLEMLRYAASIGDPADREDALDLLRAASGSELGFTPNILTDITMEARQEGVPPTWILNAYIERKQVRETTPEPFHINTEGLGL